MNRRTFNRNVAIAGAAAALSPFGIVRAQSQKLKIGVILPRSGYLGFIGQSCQKGADLAPGVIKEMLGVDIELMNADFESNVDTARTRAERLIQEGANVLVGPFDSGAASAIAQVAEQRGVPLVINIAAAPKSPSRATSSCSAISRRRATSSGTAWISSASSSRRRIPCRAPPCTCTSTTRSARR